MNARRVAFSLGLAIMLVSLAVTGPGIGLGMAWSAGSGTLSAKGLESQFGDSSTKDRATSGDASTACLCYPVVSHEIRPSVILKGEDGEVTATLAIQALCSGGNAAHHSVIILGGFGDDSGVSQREILTELESLVDSIGVDEDRSSRLGIIVVDGRDARTVLPISGDADAVHASIRRWYSSSGSNTEGLIAAAGEARIELDRAEDRMEFKDCGTPYEVVFVVGDLGGSDRCPDLSRAYSTLERSVNYAFALCLGDDCVTRCHRSISSSAEYALGAGRWSEWRSLERYGFRNVIPRRLDVETVVGPDFDYVGDSAVPPFTRITEGEAPHEGDHLIWSFDRMIFLRTGVTYTYRLRYIGEAAGSQPIVDRTDVSIWSAVDYPLRYTRQTFISPHLLILEPSEWPDEVAAESPRLFSTLTTLPSPLRQARVGTLPLAIDSRRQPANQGNK